MLLTVQFVAFHDVRKENSPSKGGCGFQQRSAEFPILLNAYDPPSYRAKNLPRKNDRVTAMATLGHGQGIHQQVFWRSFLSQRLLQTTAKTFPTLVCDR